MDVDVVTPMKFPLHIELLEHVFWTMPPPPPPPPELEDLMGLDGRALHDAARESCTGDDLLHKLREVTGNDKGTGAGVEHAVSLASSTRSLVALLG